MSMDTSPEIIAEIHTLAPDTRATLLAEIPKSFKDQLPDPKSSDDAKTREAARSEKKAASDKQVKELEQQRKDAEKQRILGEHRKVEAIVAAIERLSPESRVGLFEAIDFEFGLPARAKTTTTKDDGTAEPVRPADAPKSSDMTAADQAMRDKGIAGDTPNNPDAVVPAADRRLTENQRSAAFEPAVEDVKSAGVVAEEQKAEQKDAGTLPAADKNADKNAADHKLAADKTAADKKAADIKK